MKLNFLAIRKLLKAEKEVDKPLPSDFVYTNQNIA